jgi:dihydrofolate synthase / folylpolyglutamate synthase
MRIREFLGRIGNPHEGLRYIHVAGTKGKGSVCALTAYMLRQMGYLVGLYTSPHLSDVRERIRVLRPPGNAPDGAGEPARGEDFEGMIPEEDLTRLTDRLRPEIAAYGGESSYGQLSFFEVYTALAFLYFKEQAVDYAVLETGLGGRLDATNVVQPLIVGITSISYDHTNKLGSTLARIAAEKAGIVKLGTLSRAVVSAPQKAAARSVIRARCTQRGVRLYEIGNDITYKSVSSSPAGQEFSVNGAFGLFDHMRINLLGGHQVVNAAVAIGLIAGLLKQAGKPVPMDAVRAGLLDTRWPGRCEIVGEHPCIILDGAHNEASAAVLAQTISRSLASGRIILVFGVSKDKDVAGIGKHLIPLAKKCIVTRADNPRALPTADMVDRLKEFSAPALFVQTQSVSDALDAARQAAGKEDTIIITGSLFIVGEARQLLTRKAH